MGIRTLLSPSVDMKVSLIECWWIVGMIFVSTFVLTLLNTYMKSIQSETTIVQVQTPRMKGYDEPCASSIVINITHRSIGMRMPELYLPPSAFSNEPKKTL